MPLGGLTSVAEAADTSLTFTPVADARVTAGSPSSNYGSSTTLRAQGGGDTVNISYLKFNVSGLTGPVTSVKLRLRVTESSAHGGSVHPISSTWDESTITYNNRPDTTAGALATKDKVTSGTTVEFELGAGAVTGNEVRSFMLASSSSDSVYYSSKEGSLKPELVVTQGSATTATIPVANFTASPNPAGVNQSVTFTDTSTNSPTSWTWDFGDGTSSNLQHPTHAYTFPGAYSVVLTASNSAGSSNKTGAVTITSSSPPRVCERRRA
jgi:PKD repeat protein